MANFKWLNLQLFAGEGAGDGGGEGAATGEAGAADAGQQRLRELGVPEAVLQKRANRGRKPTQAVTTAAVEPKPQAQAAAAKEEHPAEETENKDAKPEEGKKPVVSWDDFMADPENNKRMQQTIQARIRGAKAAEETLGKLGPALEVLARKYGQDPAKIDYEALSKSIHEDNDFYEGKALEMGVPLETAKKIDQEERATARQQREQTRTLEEQKIAQHFQRLEQQAEELKKTFPNFDLRTEMQNPVFARMTAPGSGLMSVEDAYRAVHRKEIEAAQSQVIAQQTAKKLSNSIQAGSKRPQENGASGQAPSAISFDYRNASPEQRKAFKEFLSRERAQGRKVYPGGFQVK